MVRHWAFDRRMGFSKALYHSARFSVYDRAEPDAWFAERRDQQG